MLSELDIIAAGVTFSHRDGKIVAKGVAGTDLRAAVEARIEATWLRLLGGPSMDGGARLGICDTCGQPMADYKSGMCILCDCALQKIKPEFLAGRRPEEKKVDQLDLPGTAPPPQPTREMSAPATQDSLLTDLNPEQVRVVQHDKGPLLVASVAGSGKTTAVVRRMAFLAKVRGVKPDRIFGVTFSRSGASEMNTRIQALLGHDQVQVSTFHAFCRRVLSAELSGFDKLTLDDRDEYKTLMKITMERDMKWAYGDPRLSDQFIELCKANGIKYTDEGSVMAFAQKLYGVHSAKPTQNPEKLSELYTLVEKAKADKNLTTFSDWLLDARDLFRDNDAARKRWAALYDYVMVDEAQDNNLVQYDLAEQLSREHRNIMMIGDAGQSLYAFRGAQPSMFVDFPKRWTAETVSMNRNYRSGKKIIDVANDALESMAKETRCGELIVAERTVDGSVQITGHQTQEEEAQHVAQEINALHVDGMPLSDAVVIYRVNSLSRAIEAAFIEAKVPFRIVNGASFYTRREIAILLSYLRVVCRKGTMDVDVPKSIFNPTRFLGKAFLAAIKEASSQKPPTVRALVELALPNVKLHNGQQLAAYQWANLIDELRTDVAKGEGAERPSALLEKIVYETKFNDWLRRDEGSEAPDNDRVSNVAELIRAAVPFAKIESLLEHVEIQQAAFAEQKKKPREGHVTLLSCHGSKGQEWPHVFLITCNDRVMPHVLAEDVEEERRIFYVATTRARDALHVSYVQGAVSRGRQTELLPSPFIRKYIGVDNERR